jgi:pimeloyl-ACP methyl ester carboxylesterase
VKLLGRVVAAIAGLVVLILAFCAYEYRAALKVDPVAGIDEEGFVRIGGIDQWVQIRGDDRRNPVLLWLNGGPGFSTIGRTLLYRAWERQFTVVMWDQRGEGKTFDRSGTRVASTMTIAQMTKDGVDVADYVRKRLHKDKIILLGHSWGSLLGVHMVEARPDLFSVYVGTGQIVNLEKDSEAAYPLVLAKARATGNTQATQELTVAGPPPYPAEGMKKWAWVKWANALDPEGQENTRLTPALVWFFARNLVSSPGLPPGAIFSQELMWPEMLRDDLGTSALDVKIPVVFIEGTDDRVALPSLAHAYFDKIRAPSKQFVSIEGGGHLAIFTARRAFLSLLVAKARPLAH